MKTLRTFMRAFLQVHTLIFVLFTSAHATGPGLGQQSYTPSDLFEPLSMINTSAAEGYVHMVDGYLFVPFSEDGNTGLNGGFSFYDVSNPANPTAVYTYQDADTSIMVEPHGYGFSDGKLVYCARNGIIVWDISDPAAPVKLSTLNLDTASGYGNTCWSLSYQAPYVFVGTGIGGLKIVDLNDPANPVLARNIPTTELGGVSPHNIHVVGNRLFASATDFVRGLVTLDISIPTLPTLLGFKNENTQPIPPPDQYSAWLNGNRFYAVDRLGRLWIYDMAEDGSFERAGEWSASMSDIVEGSRGGYVTIQDDYVFGGFSHLITKFDVSDPANPAVVATAITDIPDADVDFAVALGNLVFVGNDHGQGSVLMPHALDPDTTGPSVNMVSPASGAVNQAISSRVGVTLTDMVLPETVNASTFFVRPLGGDPLSGTYSVQFDKINFSPDVSLVEEVTYEVVMPAGGVQDWSGNPTQGTFISSFTTAATSPISCTVSSAGPTTVDSSISQLIGQVSGASGVVSFSWDFGDGNSSGPSNTTAIQHTYHKVGNHTVLLTVDDGIGSANCTAIQQVHYQLQPTMPTRSSSIVFSAAYQRVFVANPDNDTVTAVDVNGVKLWEAPVGQDPVALAEAPAGEIWVVNADDATLHVLDAGTGLTQRIQSFPRGSRPHGVVFSPSGNAAYVTLEATGRVLKLDPVDGQVLGDLAVGSTPRGLAVSTNSKRIFVTRFISPANQGEVVEVDANDFTVTRTFTIQADTSLDSEDSGRGVPNLLNSVALSPDGRSAVVPATKDNTARGMFRDGNPLNFENTVRAMAARLDVRPSKNLEVLSLRVDFNDASLPMDASYNLIGNQIYVALQGSNRIEVWDAYNSNIVLAVIEDTGNAPRGMAFDAGFDTLFVHNYLDRTLELYDIAGVTSATNFAVTKLATVNLVSNEALPTMVLAGKKIFYNAGDARMSRDGYISCASCHLDGGSDERVWDFTDRGEGFRNTISLLGRRGTGHGNVHWTANFDEIQDFENDIRNGFGGTGLMSDADFNAGTRSDPLGDPKTGLSPDLDALAAYVTSLDSGHPSPYRNQDGSLTADALLGKQLFGGQASCASCHTGADFTDLIRHDVGTVDVHSGTGSGLPLSGVGFDTPTLLGVWESSPYLHDGSALTLLDVLANASHGNGAVLSTTEKDRLVAFVSQLEVGGSGQDVVITQECGNGVTESPEACDDGNGVDDDSCSNSCSLNFCGDGAINNGEACDDGNSIDDDGCSNSCAQNFCGDGVINNGESCDDGNGVDDDSCSNSCSANFCGDAVLNNSEECDDGNINDIDACSNSCFTNFCGDSTTNNGEQCDDGNIDNVDACSNSCIDNYCGDSIVNNGDECDDGNSINDDACSNSCTANICGDGVVNNGEECDDGNSDNNDSCSNSCVVSTPTDCNNRRSRECKGKGKPKK